MPEGVKRSNEWSQSEMQFPSYLRNYKSYSSVEIVTVCTSTQSLPFICSSQNLLPMQLFSLKKMFCASLAFFNSQTCNLALAIDTDVDSLVHRVIKMKRMKCTRISLSLWFFVRTGILQAIEVFYEITVKHSTVTTVIPSSRNW